MKIKSGTLAVLTLASLLVAPAFSNPSQGLMSVQTKTACVLAEGPGLPPFPPRIRFGVSLTSSEWLLAEGPGLPPFPPRTRASDSLIPSELLLAEGPGLPPFPPRVHTDPTLSARMS